MLWRYGNGVEQSINPRYLEEPISWDVIQLVSPVCRELEHLHCQIYVNKLCTDGTDESDNKILDSSKYWKYNKAKRVGSLT